MSEDVAELLPAVPDDDSASVAPGQDQPPDAAAAERIIYATAIYAPGDRRAIIPPPLRPENLRGTLTAFAGLQWHRSRYHGLRLPLYAAAVVFWAVAGIIRLAGRQVRWWWLLEQHWLRNDAAAEGDSLVWSKLHREAKETRKVRGWLLAGELAAAAVAVSVLAADARPVLLVLGAVALALAARFGRPAGHRIFSPAVVPPQYQEPTPDSITVALGSLGISAINQVIKDGRAASMFVSPVMRDGPGWGVQIDLPHGVTATRILAKREDLASGLRRPLSATWPATVPAEHAGRLELWVGFHDITRAKPPKWPLARAGTADVFAGIPFGTDPRQRPVIAPLFEVNWLIGAAPGQGKTAAVRVLCCGEALDPLAEMWVHELAGKGDLEPLGQVCHRYVSGLDDDSVAYAAQSARMLRAEVATRAKLFGRLPKELKPDGKVSRDLALRYLGLRPLCATFDEAQNLFMHPELGEDAADDLAYVIRLGRALGIIVKLATQRPDGVALPTRIRGIVTARFCLKVPDYDSNDMILGTGAYKAGYNSAIFRAKTDAGLGWLKADGDPQIVRTYYLNMAETQRICARARVIRERAGTLTGYALGLDGEMAAPRDVLGDVLEVLGEAPAAHWDDLAQRMAERWPDRWADLTHTALSAQCRALGVASVTVSVGGSKDKGCRKVAVEQAIDPAVSAQVSGDGGNRP
jgi:S-DNA-T family DNA segregation ATPase FtsK/SpoIIIE